MIYHLWWHPHNFGGDPEYSLSFLERVLQHFRHLAQTQGMRSATMLEVAREWAASEQPLAEAPAAGLLPRSRAARSRGRPPQRRSLRMDWPRCPRRRCGAERALPAAKVRAIARPSVSPRGQTEVTRLENTAWRRGRISRIDRRERLDRYRGL